MPNCTKPGVNCLAWGSPLPDTGTLCLQFSPVPSLFDREGLWWSNPSGGLANAQPARPYYLVRPLTTQEIRTQTKADKGLRHSFQKKNTHISNDLALKACLAKEAGLAKDPDITYLLLKKFVTIESGGDRYAIAPNRLYYGLMQMGANACHDIKKDFTRVKNPDYWVENVEAGRLYADINAHGLRKAGLAVNPMHIYMAHNQGLTGASRIIKAAQELDHGQLGTNKISHGLERNMVHNIPRSWLQKILFHKGDLSAKTITPAEFYAYWRGVFDLLDELVTDDQPKWKPPV